MRTIVDALDPDIPYRVRQWLGPWITRAGRTLGQPEYHLYGAGYVGTVEVPLDDLTETLQRGGFDWDPVAWYHQPPVGSDPNGSWTYRRSVLADRQLHVLLIAHSPEYIDVFAHEEFNWIRHPIKHARQVGIERSEGSTEVRRWLERLGIRVDTRSRRRRRGAHAIAELRYRLASAVSSLGLL